VHEWPENGHQRIDLGWVELRARLLLLHTIPKLLLEAGHRLHHAESHQPEDDRAHQHADAGNRPCEHACPNAGIRRAPADAEIACGSADQRSSQRPAEQRANQRDKREADNSGDPDKRKDQPGFYRARHSGSFSKRLYVKRKA
jgi:hypothetical protein